MSIEGIVRGVVCELLSVDKRRLSWNTRIKADLGADALDYCEVLARLERRLGVRFADDDVKHIRTFGDIITCITRRLADSRDQALPTTIAENPTLLKPSREAGFVEALLDWRSCSLRPLSEVPLGESQTFYRLYWGRQGGPYIVSTLCVEESRSWFEVVVVPPAHCGEQRQSTGNARRLPWSERETSHQPVGDGKRHAAQLDRLGVWDLDDCFVDNCDCIWGFHLHVAATASHRHEIQMIHPEFEWNQAYVNIINFHADHFLGGKPFRLEHQPGEELTGFGTRIVNENGKQVLVRKWREGPGWHRRATGPN